MRYPYHLTNGGTCAIQGGTAGTVVNGMPTETYATKTGLSAVPCNVQTSSSSDSLRWARETGEVTVTFLLPSYVGTTQVVVNAQDRIVYNGSTYRVLGMGYLSAGEGSMLKVVCSRNT